MTPSVTTHSEAGGEMRNNEARALRDSLVRVCLVYLRALPPEAKRKGAVDVLAALAVAMEVTHSATCCEAFCPKKQAEGVAEVLLGELKPALLRARGET